MFLNKKKLTKEEKIFVEEVFHEIDFERGMFQPLTDNELNELSPETRKAILIAREVAKRSINEK